MKKYMVAFMLILVACVTACSDTDVKQSPSDSNYSETYAVSTHEELNTLSDIEISWKTDELNLTSAVVVLDNTSDKDYYYSYFEIEAEQNGIWYELNCNQEPISDESLIQAHEITEAAFNISEYYGTLSDGHYRLILPVAYYNPSKNWDYETYYLSCEFTID